jgi:hypothetical protein
MVWVYMGYIGFIYLTVDKTDVGFCQVATDGTGLSPPQNWTAKLPLCRTEVGIHGKGPLI